MRSVEEIQAALRSNKVADRNPAVRAMLRGSPTVMQAYRWALAYVPDLTLDTWLNWVEDAQKRDHDY